ncbi:hypothetical protein GOODEAATRI_017073 [Goodea atripinnis]|uniref:TLC domain-containing protein n=1 Tax=Goodea atripinnis TaxID=208336 RepID=A0ABV0N265_9TELE
MVVLNGVAMAVVFFAVRIAVMPSYWASVFATFGTPEFERLGLGAQVAWITSCIALDVLNTIWMYKIARGCYKVLTGRGGRKIRGHKHTFSTICHSCLSSRPSLLSPTCSAKAQSSEVPVEKQESNNSGGVGSQSLTKLRFLPSPPSLPSMSNWELDFSKPFSVHSGGDVAYRAEDSHIPIMFVNL